MTQENQNRELVSVLSRQFEIAWMLTDYHLQTLSTEECLWRPAEVGLHVWQQPDGSWQADWPEHEGYDLGPSSLAWLTWHLGFWWSMVLEHSFGEGKLTREAVIWPGDADGVRNWIKGLQERWRKVFAELSDQDLRKTDKSRWPMQDVPFSEIVAWLNIELAKNAAEIGSARFHYAVKA